MPECPHPKFTRVTVIDKLGPMRSVGPDINEVEAEVLQSHIECRACGATIPKKEAPHD